MKRFFERKQNRVLVAVIVAALVLVVAVILTVTVTRKHKAYEPETTVPPMELLTDAPVAAETTAEATETESSETDVQTSSKKDENTSVSESDAPKKDKNKDKDKAGGSGSGNKSPVINLGSILLEGRWGMTEYISPSELFDADFLAETGFNKKLCVSTTYRFNKNKTFIITYEVGDENDYVAALREAYKIYYKDEHPEWTPETLDNRMDQDAWKTFWEICEEVIGVSYNAAQISGTYSNDDTTIYYQCDGVAFSETYVIKDKTLTLTGSSEGNDGYPITLTRW